MSKESPEKFSYTTEQWEEKILPLVRNLERKYELFANEVPGSYRSFQDRIRVELKGLAEFFGGLENLMGKRILELGCGSFESHRDSLSVAPRKSYDTRQYEPWLCRALYFTGANPVGIDIRDNSGEEFENYKGDLTVPGALDFLPDKSFDGIVSSHLLVSPTLIKVFSGESINEQPNLQEVAVADFDHKFKERRKAMAAELRRQADRLLKAEGYRNCDFDSF